MTNVKKVSDLFLTIHLQRKHMTKNNKQPNSLSFDLDVSQSTELTSFESRSFPSTRSGFIELIEDKPEYIKIGSAIDCQSLEWEFKCPLKWSKLKKTKFDDVRFCTLCEERVYTAYSKAELKRLTSQGSCVRVITEKQMDVMGDMSDPYFYDESLEHLESIALLDAIIELARHIEQFKMRRDYYPALKLTKLLGRFERFEKQVETGLRDRETGLPKEVTTLSESKKNDCENKAIAVKELINKRAEFEEKLQQANEYITLKSLEM